MGLDITYYSNIIKATLVEYDTEEDQEDEFYNHDIYTQDNIFNYQLGSLKKITAYDMTSHSETGHISMGSYGGYNSWRNQLAVLAGYVSAKEVWIDIDFDPMKTKFYSLRYHNLKKLKNPDYEIKNIKSFYEIINFSDCEAVIGPEISKKLYRDFIDFDDKAKNEEKYFYEKYKELTEAFRVASKKGAVVYH